MPPEKPSSRPAAPEEELPPLSRNQWLLASLWNKSGTQLQWWEENRPELLQEAESLREALELGEYNLTAVQARAEGLVNQWVAESKAAPSPSAE
jgi:hypothetical protein